MIWICLQDLGINSPALTSSLHLVIWQNALPFRWTFWVNLAKLPLLLRAGFSAKTTSASISWRKASPASLQSSIQATLQSMLCKDFLLQCVLFFASQLNMTDGEELAKFISLLTGKALEWAWEAQAPALCTLNCFCAICALSREWGHRGAAPVISPRQSMSSCFGVLYPGYWQWLKQASTQGCISLRPKYGHYDRACILLCANLIFIPVSHATHTETCTMNRSCALSLSSLSSSSFWDFYG